MTRVHASLNNPSEGWVDLEEQDLAKSDKKNNNNNNNSTISINSINNSDIDTKDSNNNNNNNINNELTSSKDDLITRTPSSSATNTAIYRLLTANYLGMYTTILLGVTFIFGVELIPLGPVYSYFYPGQLWYLIPHRIGQSLPFIGSLMYDMDGIQSFETFSRSIWMLLMPSFVDWLVAVIILLIEMFCNIYPLPMNNMILSVSSGVAFVFIVFSFPKYFRKTPIFMKNFVAASSCHNRIVSWFFICIGYLVLFYYLKTFNSVIILIVISGVFTALSSMYKIYVRVYCTGFFPKLLESKLTDENRIELVIGFMFLLELSSNSFSTFVYPGVSNWGVIAFILAFDSAFLVLQLVLTAEFFLAKLEERFSRSSRIFELLNLTWPRRFIIALYFFTCMCRLLSSSTYLFAAAFMHYSYNAPYFPLFQQMTEEQFVLTLEFGGLSFVIILIQMIISQIILQKVYNLSMVNCAFLVYKKRPFTYFISVACAFAFGFVAIKSQCNILPFAMRYFS